MTVLTATFDTVALGADSGSVEFFCVPVRTSSGNTSIITQTPVIVSLVNGTITTPSLDPGPAKVRMNIGTWRDTYDIVIPQLGPTGLVPLLEQYAQPVPSVVSSAWTAEQAAQAAAGLSTYNAQAAAAAATAAAQSAATAAGVAGVGPATSSTPGLIQLTGALGGTATSPTVPGLALLAPIASPTFTGTPVMPALHFTAGTVASGNVMTSDGSGNITLQPIATVPLATSSVPGLIQLTGPFGGTATAPTIPILSTLAPLNTPTFTGTVTLASILITGGTQSPGTAKVLTSDSAGYGTWQPLPTAAISAAMAMFIG